MTSSYTLWREVNPERRPPLSGLSSKGPAPSSKNDLFIHPSGEVRTEGGKTYVNLVVLNQDGETRVRLGHLIQFTKSCAIASILSGSSSRSNSMIESQSKSLGATSSSKNDQFIHPWGDGSSKETSSERIKLKGSSSKFEK